MADLDNIIHAFSFDHVVRLTGFSKSRLTYMDKTRFFSPDLAYENRRSPYSRIYSFKDVVALRTIAMLRDNHRFSLQKLRKVAGELKKIQHKPWSNMKIYVGRDDVVFREPDTGRMRQAVNKQYVAEYAVQDVMNNILEESRKLRERGPEKIGQIDRHRYVAHNKWVVSGTRIPTQAILNYHEAGYTVKKILKEYPTLTEDDIRAALEHEDKIAKQA